MARAVGVDETIPCPSIRSGEATERILIVARSDYKTVSASATRIHFARTTHPTWSVVLGIILLPVIIGIPLLLMKRTETWVAALEEDHRIVQVHVTGTVLPSVMAAMHESLGAGPAAAAKTLQGPIETVNVNTVPDAVHDTVVIPGFDVAGANEMTTLNTDTTVSLAITSPLESPPVTDPPATEQRVTAGGSPDAGSGDGGMTLLRRPSDPADVSRDAAIGSGLVVFFDTGEHLELDEGESAFVGRSPEMIGGLSRYRLLQIDDPERSISKTHLRLDREKESWFVSDLGSTNGTSVGEGRNSPLAPIPSGTPVRIEEGGTIQFGKRSAEVRRK